MGAETQFRYIVSKNLHRRHLSPGQRALAAAKAIDFYEELAKERQRAAGRFDGRNEDGTPRLQVPEPGPEAENDNYGDSRDQVGQLFDVSGRSVSRAKTILDHGTDKEIEAVEKGEVGLKPIEEKIRERLKGRGTADDQSD